MFRLPLALLLLAAGTCSLPAQVANPAEAEAQRCEDRIASVQREVLNKYETALTELQNGFQKNADLENALAVRAEHQRLSRENSLSPAQYVSEPKNLRALQTQTVARLQELVGQLVDETLPRLIEAKRSLTVAGRLDEAVAVRASIEKLHQRSASAAPPAPGSVVPAEAILRAYAADRGRADKQYKGREVIIRGLVAGYRADPDGRQYHVYLGAPPPAVTGYVQCSFPLSDFKAREETQFGNPVLTLTWGRDSTARLQRGAPAEISGEVGGWDETVRLRKCEFPK